MADLLLLAPAFAAVLILIWAVHVLSILREMRRDLIRAPRRRRGSNPPPPGCKPAPPAGPPLVASQADAERLAAQLQENAKELIAVGYANESRELLELGVQVAGAATYLVSEKSIRFDEGPTQRGNSGGGPATPKPAIKPQPAGPRMVGDSIKPPPIKPQFPPPRKIRDDFL